MKDGKGTLTKRARYVADMCELLAQRAERYEAAVDTQTLLAVEKFKGVPYTAPNGGGNGE